MIIAIDGPSGAGKSTVAKAVAKELGFSCLDTGAMYRAVAWRALHDGVSLEDAEAVGALAHSCTISFRHEQGDPVPRRVFVDDVEVTGAIRTAEIDRSVSAVSAVPAVRQALLDQQRRIGSEGNYVVEGRDIGTEVFPNAEVKVFLTASAEESAQRRVRELAPSTIRKYLMTSSVGMSLTQVAIRRPCVLRKMRFCLIPPVCMWKKLLALFVVWLEQGWRFNGLQHT